MQREADNRLLIGYVSAATVLLHLLLIPLWVAWLDRDHEHSPPPELRAKCNGECDESEHIMTLQRRACKDPIQCPRPTRKNSTQVVLVVRDAPKTSPTEPRPEDDPIVEEKPPEPEEKPPEPEDDDPKQFVVLAEKPLNEPPAPDDARFAATHNTRAEVETVSRSNDLGSGQGPRQPGATTAPAPPSPSPQSNPTPRKPRQPKKPRRPKTPPKGAPDFEAIMAREAEKISPPKKSNRGPEPDPESGKPRRASQGQPDATSDPDAEPAPPIELAELARVDPSLQEEAMSTAGGGGGGGSIDYLNDVAEGEKTVLSRKRVAHAGFFERVTLGIKNHWDPVRVYRRRDPTGRIYGVQDRVTIVRITLNGDGTLASLFVEGPSGLDFLDDEAVRSVRAAAPFPNPPEGLKDVQGRIHFSFGFHFEITTRSRRLFRFNK